MKILFKPRILGMLLLFLCGACSGTFKNTIDFAPTEPLRVAVLPVLHLTDDGEVDDQYADAFVDHVVVISKKLEDSPSTLVQGLVQNEISNTALDLVAPPYVDAQLVHYGYAKEKRLDLKKVYETDAKTLCKLLTCDAILFTKLTDWDRSYYGLQAVITFGFDTRLVRAADNKEIFSSSAKDYDSRGISKVPTGWTSLVLEPLKGLDNEILIELAQKTVSRAFEPLRVENRQEYLKAPPPLIVGAVHNAASGTLGHSGQLEVMLLGSPETDAWFNIGNVITGVPLIEVNAGRYVGEYHPLSSDSFKNAEVQVFLRDAAGRVSKRALRQPVTLQ